MNPDPAGPADSYRVTLQFAGDRTVSGEWAEAKTAEKKFASWIWLYGRTGVTATLTARTGDGPPTTVKRWPSH